MGSGEPYSAQVSRRDSIRRCALSSRWLLHLAADTPSAPRRTGFPLAAPTPQESRSCSPDRQRAGKLAAHDTDVLRGNFDGHSYCCCVQHALRSPGAGAVGPHRLVDIRDIRNRLAILGSAAPASIHSAASSRGRPVPQPSRQTAAIGISHDAGIPARRPLSPERETSAVKAKLGGGGLVRVFPDGPPMS